MKDYPYISIQLIDGKIKVVCNELTKPSESIGLLSVNHLIWLWQQNHEVFEFANPHEEGKIMRCIGGMNPQIKYGLEVTCIEIKDGKAWFKEETTNENNQTKLAGEIIGIVKNHKGSGNALFKLLTKYKITRK